MTAIATQSAAGGSPHEIPFDADLAVCEAPSQATSTDQSLHVSALLSQPWRDHNRRYPRHGPREQFEPVTLRAALTLLRALQTGVLEVDRAMNNAIYGEGSSAADVLDGKVRAAHFTTTDLG